eukprot:g3883.t1
MRSIGILSNVKHSCRVYSGSSAAEERLPGWLRMGLKVLGWDSKEAVNIRQANALLQCASSSAVDYERFRDQVGLQNDFRDNHSIQSLHMWMLNRRIGFNQGEEKDAVALQQELFDLYWEDSIARIRKIEGVRELMVNKHLRTAQGYTFKMMKDMDKAIEAFGTEGKQDEGTLKLGQAIWMNVFRADESALDENVERVISYTERNLELLTDMNDDDVLWGRVEWDKI